MDRTNRIRTVAVIGAGITGLSCAYFLKKWRPNWHVVVFEKKDRLGGNICTIHEKGYWLDMGPDGWVAVKPEMARLAADLGLEGKICTCSPQSKKVYIAHGQKLIPMPDGFVLGLPTKITPFLLSPLFSLRGKCRAAADLFIPPDLSDSDESVGHFFERRVGKEMVDKLAGPLLGGVFSGDVYQLSVKTAFPQLKALEMKYGSLFRAIRVVAKQRQNMANGATFLSLRGGLETLIEALKEALLRMGVEIHINSHLLRLTRSSEENNSHKKWKIHLSSSTMLGLPSKPLGSNHKMDDGWLVSDVVCAGPFWMAKNLVGPHLETWPAVTDYASTRTVLLGFRRHQIQHSLNASGLIVPKSEKRALQAASFLSTKWADRAPPGKVILRAFFPERETQTQATDFISLTCETLHHWLGIRGEPDIAKTIFLEHASPRLAVGHLDRVAFLRKELKAKVPGVYVCGNGYDGSGIPDCIRQANETASEISGASISYA